MKKKELMDYVGKYIELGILQGKSTLSGDYKTGNRAANKMDKIFQISISCENRALFYEKILETTQDINTIIWASLHMLKLNINPEKARAGLLKIAKGGGDIPPIFATSARLTLEEWDKGNIQPII